MKRALALLLLLAAPLATSVWAQVHTAIPGTRVSLATPAGFDPATRFPGLEQRKTSSTLMVTETRTPLEEFRAGLTDQAMRERGAMLLSTESLGIEGRPATIHHVRQELAGVSFRKWLLVFGDETHTVMVTASTPEPLAEQLEPVLLAALRDTRWEPENELDLLAGLPFRVEETATLKFSNRVANLLSLTRDGRRNAVGADEPLLVVVVSESQAASAELEGFGQAQLGSIAQIRGVTTSSSRAIQVGGLPGHEIVATAEDVRTGVPLLVYLAVIAGAERAYVAQGLVSAQQGDEFLPEFRRVSESLREAP